MVYKLQKLLFKNRIESQLMVYYRPISLSIFLFFVHFPVAASTLYGDNHSLPLFKWLDQQQISFQWGTLLSKETDNKNSSSTKTKNTAHSFSDDSILYLSWHRNILQFPYILKWGVKGNLEWIYQKGDVWDSLKLFLSSIITLQLIDPQYVVPFVEIGALTENVDFSTITPFWSAGVLLSFAILKTSLVYTLPDEYGIHDMGVILELKTHKSLMDGKDFLRYFHIGAYLLF